MFINYLTALLADNNTEPNPIQQYSIYIVIGVLLVALIVYFFVSGRSGKRRQKEYTEMLEAIGPGNKVKTAGGICGIVVEVCDDNTVIIETGSELSGKSYIKMDKELIAQTDAKGPTQIAREEAEAAKKAAKEAKNGKDAKPRGETSGQAENEGEEKAADEANKEETE